MYSRSIEPLAAPLGAWLPEEEYRVVADAFASGEASLIVRGSARVGWLHVRHTREAVELWQLFVAPPHRGVGIGGSVLDHLQNEARTRAAPILLSVLRNNRARHLYAQKGFVPHAEGPHHLFLWWSPEPAPDRG